MAPVSALRPFIELISLRSFVPPLCALAGRPYGSAASAAFAAASSNAGGGHEGDDGFDLDTKYRSPTELVWPASKRQERFASRLHTALSTVLLHNNQLRDALVTELGFAVKDVRMSPDNLKAFIQWDSVTGQAGALQRELRNRAPKLRAELARALKARNVPALVFRHDGPTERQREIEDIFGRLDEEAEAERAAGAEAAGAPTAEPR